MRHSVLVFVSILTLLLVGLGGVPHVRGNSGNVLSSFGTAKADGVISPGEYGSCIGPITQGAYTFTICETNDGTNDYYALQMSGDTNPTTPSTPDLFELYFDNTHDGTLTTCANGVEDKIEISYGAGVIAFYDMWYCTTSSDDDGSINGAGAISEASTPFVFEMSHPLSSGDVNDYSLTVGSTVGWCMGYIDDGVGQVVQYPSGCINDWEINALQGSFGSVVKVGPPSPSVPSVPVGGQLVAVDQPRILLSWLALIALLGIIVVPTLIAYRRPRVNH